MEPRIEREDFSLTLRELTSDESRAEVSSYGAHLLSWGPSGQPCVVWRPKAVHVTPGTPIQGGIPVALPWFGTGFSGGQVVSKTPRHGCARLVFWEEDRSEGAPANVASYTLDSSRVPAKYLAQMESEGIPEFLASYTVEIGENLRATLKVTNTGKCAFTYEEALHTYLHVGSTAGAALEGLEGKDYLDATLPGAPRKVQEHAPVRFDGPVDRIYMSRDELTLRDQMLRRSITVSKEGSKRTVVWNPGREAGDAIADLEKGEWNSFVCVEAANCREDAVTLQPGESHILSQTLSVSQG